jgi:hypothetical protein
MRTQLKENTSMRNTILTLILTSLFVSPVLATEGMISIKSRQNPGTD